MTATAPRIQSPAPSDAPTSSFEPVRSAVGPPEVIDPNPSRRAFALVMVAVLVGLAMSLWALTDSLQATRSIELPTIDVPKISSLDIAAARAQLEKAGFVVDVQYQPNEKEPKGVVIDQRPLAGSKLEQGELVVILASDGPLGLAVPSVEGQQSGDATATLQMSGLQVVAVPTSSETVRPNEVIGTDPPERARVPQGGTVRLLVSSGPAPRTVPAIINKTMEQGLADIGRAGLAVGKIKKVFRQDLLPGTVFEVDPAVGTAVPRDTPISLSVAGPKPTTTVPYLVGLQQASAVRVASLAGIKLEVVTSPVAAGDPLEGRVISQGVPPQTEMEEDSTVQITVAFVPTPVAAATPPAAPGG